MKEFRFQNPDSLAFTDRCSDFKAFMAGMKGTLDRNLQDHLRICPVCRLVAADAIRNLVTEGESPAPTREIQALAKTISEKNSEGVIEDDERRITVSFTEGVLRADGLPHQVSKGPCVKLVADAKPYPLQLTFEPVGEKFLMRIVPQSATDAIAVLKGADGLDIAPARKFTASLSWAGLLPGTYTLRVSGKEGSTGFRIRIA